MKGMKGPPGKQSNTKGKKKNGIDPIGMSLKKGKSTCRRGDNKRRNKKNFECVFRPSPKNV